MAKLPQQVRVLIPLLTFFHLPHLHFLPPCTSSKRNTHAHMHALTHYPRWSAEASLASHKLLTSHCECLYCILSSRNICISKEKSGKTAMVKQMKWITKDSMTALWQILLCVGFLKSHSIGNLIFTQYLRLTLLVLLKRVASDKSSTGICI